jgi:hypothetical protein
VTPWKDGDFTIMSDEELKLIQYAFMCVEELQKQYNISEIHTMPITEALLKYKHKIKLESSRIAMWRNAHS